MSDASLLPEDLHLLFREVGVGSRTLSVDLPPGRIVFDEEDSGAVASLWLSDEPPAPGLWGQLLAEHRASGLWPLLLEAAYFDASRPWAAGELRPQRMSSPSAHDAGQLLAQWWDDYTALGDGDTLSESQRRAVTAPFERTWPGLTVHPDLTTDTLACAVWCAESLLQARPGARLGLIAADPGADALAAAGWMGACNYTNDTGELCAVLRDWEKRFGVTVVGAGFAELYLSVAAPPADLDMAIRVAAEHFAFCPDNIWQGRQPFTLTGYAEGLVADNAWAFWWD